MQGELELRLRQDLPSSERTTGQVSRRYGYSKYINGKRPVNVIVTVYGNAITTIRMYDSRNGGTSADVRRKTKAAWPLGVATLGCLSRIYCDCQRIELIAVDCARAGESSFARLASI
jgi:hypothetical protein